jgi:FkbM family methyltransferase
MNKIYRRGINIGVAIKTEALPAQMQTQQKNSSVGKMGVFIKTLWTAPIAFIGNQISYVRRNSVKAKLLALEQQTTHQTHVVYEVLKILNAHQKKIEESMQVAFQQVEQSQANGAAELKNSFIKEAALSRNLAQQLVTQVLEPSNEKLNRIENYTYASARRVALPTGKDEMMIRSNVGYVLCAASDHALVAALIENGELETGTRLLIEKFTRPGDTFVDVGANIGMHSLAAARVMQGNGKIIAFEPFEQTFKMLEKSLWFNGHGSIVDTRQMALSSKAGKQTFYLGNTSGHHSLYQLSDQISKIKITVIVRTLDQEMGKKTKIDLLKIDAEGAELEILRGAEATFKSNPDMALIVEYGASHLARIGQTPKQWFDAFKTFDFQHKVINEQTGALEDWAQNDIEKSASINLFFARKSSPAWKRLKQ